MAINSKKRNKKSQKEKKSFPWKLTICFILFEIIFTAITAPLLVYKGPFKNVKKTIVGAAMTTLSHQYIAKAFLSDEEINKILSENVIENIEQKIGKGKNGIKISGKHDSQIERYDIDGKKFKGYVLIVHDPTRVKVGCSSKLGKEGQLTSEIAKNENAIAAINGGGFSDKTTNSLWTGTGGKPIGILISKGKMLPSDVKDFNKKLDIMALTKEGVLLVGEHSINEMKKLGVENAISFKPALVVNGEPTIKKGDGNWGIAPRTAIGQRKDGSIILLVIDGRQAKSLGATLKEVQDVMLDYGAYNATNLDGGSSSTMYYDDEVINNPCDTLGERAVPSVVYVE